MKHLLYSKDITRDQMLSLFERARHYLPMVEGRNMVHDAKGKILASIFYEPSTRTRFSFETAMHRLGGQVISNDQMEFTSSAKKGETLYDTGKVVSLMADIIAMRHPEAGSVAELAKGSDVPVINAGDGPKDHPTQGLLDLFTIQQCKGRLEDLVVGMVGDLKYGRVVHSQFALLSRFKNIKFVLVSPEELRMPEDTVAELKGSGFEVVETTDIGVAFKECDVISLTRVQKERFPNEAEYYKHKGSYVITEEQLSHSKEDMILIHPLPRVDELSVAVDNDPRAKYFRQIQYGVATRMALLMELLQS